MKNKLSALVMAASLLFLAAGCYSTIDGRVKPGIPFAKDEIRSSYERTPDQVFGATKEVLRFNGTLEGENTINKTLWAKVDTRTVWVKVEEIDSKLTRVIVQARTKGGRSDIDLASEIDKQIALRLVRP